MSGLLPDPLADRNAPAAAPGGEPRDVRRRRELIEATISSITRFGLSATTVAKVAELAGLSTPDNPEGRSLVPQLRDPQAPRDFPAITTQGPVNHGIRDERYRYIRYADGSEELYDIQQDPNEWDNLAGDSQYAETLARHRKWLPKSVKPAPGSRSRILIYENGKVNWEGKEVGKDDPIPEL